MSCQLPKAISKVGTIALFIEGILLVSRLRTAMKSVCDKYGALFILDEVSTPYGFNHLQN